MATIEEIFKKHKKSLSPMSLKQYVNTINGVLGQLKTDDYKILYKNPQEIIKKLRETYDNNNTLKNKTASIISFLKCLEIESPKDKKEINEAIERYADLVDICSSKIHKALIKNKKTEEQNENWMSVDDYENLKKILMDEIPNTINTSKDLIKIRNAVLFHLYDDIPSRLDMADAKILYKTKASPKLSKEFNYIVLDKTDKTAEYYLNKYKTEGTYGKKKIAINSDLYDLLDKYKKALAKFNKENWLFLNNNATDKLSRNNLGITYSNLGKKIGKKMTATLNRHIKVSQNIDMDKVHSLADKMGHSVNEALKVYAKK